VRRTHGTNASKGETTAPDSKVFHGSKGKTSGRPEFRPTEEKSFSATIKTKSTPLRLTTKLRNSIIKISPFWTSNPRERANIIANLKSEIWNLKLSLHASRIMNTQYWISCRVQNVKLKAKNHNLKFKDFWFSLTENWQLATDISPKAPACPELVEGSEIERILNHLYGLPWAQSNGSITKKGHFSACT